MSDLKSAEQIHQEDMTNDPEYRAAYLGHCCDPVEQAVAAWNADKPHRCPQCHAVAVDMERPSRWRVYQCCRCGTRFARFPRLSRWLPFAGVRCSEHGAGAGRKEGAR